MINYISSASTFSHLPNNDLLSHIEKFNFDYEGYFGTIHFAHKAHGKENKELPLESKDVNDSLNRYGRFIAPGSVVIDIGANNGDTAIPLAIATKGGKVFAFEPGAQFATQLNINIGLNPSLNIVGIPCAVMETPGIHTFLYCDKDYNGGCAASNAWVGTYNVPRLVRAVTFNQVFSDPSLVERISFVKIDTEGHDFHILWSFRETLKRVRPIILAEWFPRTDRQIVQVAEYLDYDIFCGFTLEPLKIGLSPWRQDIVMVPRERVASYSLMQLS